VMILPPLEEASHLGAHDGEVTETGKEILDGVQYQALGLHLIDGVLQPYEETFEVELAGDFNVTVDFDVFDEEELSRDQFAQVVAKGGDVAGELFGGFFKGDEDARFAMLDRLRSVLRQFGWAGLVVVVDRVDEPTLIGGDPERMKAVIWPLMSNKFLQYEGVGVKMLLPMELRHALFRESSAFFQSARLHKQCPIERLAWTGPPLYDLCEQRLEACRRPDAPPVHLLDLFAPDVSRAELFEALEKLHQPRDAFKMLYRCILEHCQSVTRDAPEWKIPRHVLVNVVKAESERVQQMQRGIRPA